MTTREKIEVMEAFERGEEIQYARKGSEYWFDCNRIPDWAWDKRLYRVKPKPLPIPKFKAGDLLVYVKDDGLPTPFITEIVSVSKWYYMAKGLGSNNEPLNREISRVDKNHINADDVLWYWEYETIDGDWRKLDYRYTTEQAQAVMTLSQQKTLTPLYNLGFRLPKENQCVSAE